VHEVVGAHDGHLAGGLLLPRTRRLLGRGVLPVGCRGGGDGRRRGGNDALDIGVEPELSDLEGVLLGLDGQFPLPGALEPGVPILDRRAELVPPSREERTLGWRDEGIDRHGAVRVVAAVLGEVDAELEEPVDRLPILEVDLDEGLRLGGARQRKARGGGVRRTAGKGGKEDNEHTSEQRSRAESTHPRFPPSLRRPRAATA
jgi:hypothetical protein